MSNGNSPDSTVVVYHLNQLMVLVIADGASHFRFGQEVRYGLRACTPSYITISGWMRRCRCSLQTRRFLCLWRRSVPSQCHPMQPPTTGANIQHRRGDQPLPST
ncbi:hypothetical protein CBL_11005 [Carabus blaptoides fortunei]